MKNCKLISIIIIVALFCNILFAINVFSEEVYEMCIRDRDRNSKEIKIRQKYRCQNYIIL